MTIEQITGVSLAQLEAMTDSELQKWFEPMFRVVREPIRDMIGSKPQAPTAIRTTKSRKKSQNGILEEVEKMLFDIQQQTQKAPVV